MRSSFIFSYRNFNEVTKRPPLVEIPTAPCPLGKRRDQIGSGIPIRPSPFSRQRRDPVLAGVKRAVRKEDSARAPYKSLWDSTGRAPYKSLWDSTGRTKRVPIWFVGLIFILSGCLTTTANLEEDNQRLRSKITHLETELKKQQNENLLLRQRLNGLTEAQGITGISGEVSKGEVIVKMPNAQEIQTALKNAGFYEGEIDGKIGLQTKEAIKEFQEAHKLNPDGVVGSRTWEILVGYLNASSE